MENVILKVRKDDFYIIALVNITFSTNWMVLFNIYGNRTSCYISALYFPKITNKSTHLSLVCSFTLECFLSFALADLGGVPGARPPYGTQFFHFRKPFRWKVPASGVHAPPPYGKSWIRHCSLSGKIIIEEYRMYIKR